MRSVNLSKWQNVVAKEVSKSKKCAAFFCAAAHPGAALWKKWQLLPVGSPNMPEPGKKKRRVLSLLVFIYEVFNYSVNYI